MTLYRVLDDIEAGAPCKWREKFRDHLPSTVPLFHDNVKGAIQLTEPWMQFVRDINDEAGRKYHFKNGTNNTVFRDAVGWHNMGAGNLVEQITFSGNLVDVYEIDGYRAYIKTFFINDRPPSLTACPQGLVHILTTQYKDRLYCGVDKDPPVFPRTFVIAKEGQRLWIDTRNIAKINVDPIILPVDEEIPVTPEIPLVEENKMLIGYDYWEGNPDVDEAQIASVVKFVSIRLNDMNGGHHMDQLFTKHWSEAVNFPRFFYFVYNPWKDGLGNWNWMKANMPTDGPKRFAVDIEVRYANYSPSTYAQQVDWFLSKAISEGMKPVVYTGNWFLEYLSSWRNDVDYWWARYPNAAQPLTTPSTFDALVARMNGLTWAPGSAPGPVKLWQVSDKWQLPGTGTHAVDINLWNGTYQELLAWIDGTPPIVVPPPGTGEDRLPAFLTELQTLIDRYKK